MFWKISGKMFVVGDQRKICFETISGKVSEKSKIWLEKYLKISCQCDEECGGETVV